MEFNRFELMRAGGAFFSDRPLREFAWIGLGDDPKAHVEYQRAYEDSVDRPPRSAEAAPPPPALDAPPPPERFGVGLEEKGGDWQVSAGDFRPTIDKDSGALKR